MPLLYYRRLSCMDDFGQAFHAQEQNISRSGKCEMLAQVVQTAKPSLV